MKRHEFLAEIHARHRPCTYPEIGPEIGVDGDGARTVEKFLWQHEMFGQDRFLIQLTIGSIPHERTLHAIELLGTEVAPRVRVAVGRRSER